MYDNEIAVGDTLVVPPTVRTLQVTDRRKGGVELMSKSTLDSDAMLLTLSELVNAGFCAGIAGVEKIDDKSDKKTRAMLTRKIAAKLAPWKTAKHYGDMQHLFMAGLGWMPIRNILQISPRQACVRSEGVPHCLPVLLLVMLLRLLA